jgi:acyl-CoA synthetase (NDP forming)
LGRNNVEQPSGVAGNIGFLSQSGTHAINFSLYGSSQGLQISKAISYGNAVVLDSPDLLEYLMEDDETTVIGMYIEGPRDGRRLFEVIKRIPPRKPLLIWRGGQTPAGSRATASHTASLGPVLATSGRPCFGKPGRSVLTVWKKWLIPSRRCNGSNPALASALASSP